MLRRLKQWADDGYLIRTVAPSGRSVITTLHKSVPPSDPGSSTSPILMPRTAVAAVSGHSVHPARGDEQDGHVVFSATPTNSPDRSGSGVEIGADEVAPLLGIKG